MKEPKMVKLNKIADGRGWLQECMRNDWPEFEKFGQVYITCCYPGVVKGWHKHKLQTDNFICIKGNAQVVITKDGKKFYEYCIGDNNPSIVIIPKDYYHGFTALGGEECIIMNVTTHTYNYKNPDEQRKPYNHFKKFKWGDVNG